MFAKHYRLPVAAIMLAALASLPQSVASAQSRQFSFAYDQPKTSGYGVGAEMFNTKLMELSKGIEQTMARYQQAANEKAAG